MQHRNRVDAFTMRLPSTHTNATKVRTPLRTWLSASLSRRLTLGLIVALLLSASVLMGLMAMVNHSALRAQQETSAKRMARLFEASLQNAMVKGDLEGMADILQYLGRAPGVAQAQLLSPQGEVRFSSHEKSAAEKPAVAASQLCTGARCQERMHWASGAAGGERLQIAYPILNQARCSQCHGPTDRHPVNGLLVVDFLPQASAFGVGPVLLLASAGLGGLALFALIMLMTLRRQVNVPLSTMAHTADKLAGGDLTARVNLPSRDELGRVSQAFDRMAERLGETVRALQEERHFLQQLIDGMPDPVIVIDSNYRIRMANHAYTELLGWNPTEVVGQCCHLISRGLRDACPSTLVTCPVAEIRRHARPVRSMMSLQRADGSSVDVDIDAAPLTMKDGSTLVIEVLRPLERTLRFSQQQRLSTIGLLANGVAHEIHNPLASIRIALQASLRGLRKGAMDSEELVDYLQLVDHEIDRCVLITQRMMQMSQTPTEALHPINVSSAVDDVLALLREECRVRKVHVSVQHMETSLNVWGDEAELRQVLVNLLHNALHAMPNGGQIHIVGELFKARKQLRLSVKDTGCGISTEDLPLIFMPFFSRRVDGRRGTGLGLAISKATMERFGGTIDVTSYPGQGTCFTLNLVYANDLPLEQDQPGSALSD